MSEMVERVALAISGGDDLKNILSIHRTRARLAIEALREPTEIMCRAPFRAGVCQGDEQLHFGTAEAVWRAMIDEALK